VFLSGWNGIAPGGLFSPSGRLASALTATFVVEGRPGTPPFWRFDQGGLRPACRMGRRIDWCRGADPDGF